jgi:tetratricopeptide (TPR) repeat protein
LPKDYTAIQLDANRWFATGQIELAKGEYTNALTAFNKAQEFMPNSALPFYGQGNTYFASQKYDDALRLYQRALQIDPKLAMGYKKLGDTQRVLGKEKEAIAAYKSAIQYGYNTLETRYWLGTLMLETKQIEEAIKILEAVAKDMPKPEVFISIGNGYEKLKRHVSAIEAYQKAIDADPNSALAYYKLADVYQSQREYTKAKESYEKALALDPEGKTVNKTEAQKKLRETSNKINK